MFTETELKKIIGLAKLYVDPEELPALARELDSVVAFAGQVGAAETDGAVVEEGVPLEALRADEVMPSLDRALILENAGQAEDGFFVAGGNRG